MYKFNPLIRPSEPEIRKIRKSLSEYYSKELSRPFNIDHYIEKEKYGDEKVYWVSFEKLPDDMDVNRLIIYFDTYHEPTSYKKAIRLDGKKEQEVITHIDIIKMDEIKYAFGLKKEKRENKYKTYLMLDTSTGYIKIGKAKNPNIRERTLQSEKPTIELIHTIETNVEGILHKKYSHKRIRGEWFDLSKQDIVEIKNSAF